MSIEIDDASLDLRAESISRLKAVFPLLLTEGRVDFARLKDLLAGELAEADYYELTWAGKAAARRDIQKRTTATLAPDFDAELNPVASENVFVEGEQKLFCVVETRGASDARQLGDIERLKIRCGERHFAALGRPDVFYRMAVAGDDWRGAAAS